jgi:hypothetical protein
LLDNVRGERRGRCAGHALKQIYLPLGETN